MILLNLLFTLTTTAMAHHANCGVIQADLGRCLAAQKKSLTAAQLKRFRDRMKKMPIYQAGFAAIKEIYYAREVDGFEVGRIEVEYGVIGHGPGGDLKGGFVARQVAGTLVGRKIELEIVGQLRLPHPFGAIALSEVQIKSIDEIKVQEIIR